MTHYVTHTLETAPAASKPMLEKLKGSVGMIPNLAAAMSESPQLIEGFVTLRGLFHASSSFTPAEREMIGLVNAVETEVWGTGGNQGYNAPPVPYVFTKVPNTSITGRGIRTNRGGFEDG